METIDKRQEFQDDSLRIIQTNRKCGIGGSVGSGKTLIGLRSVNLLVRRGKNRILVVYPKKSVKESWIDEATKRSYTHLLKYITFVTYRSFYKMSLDFDCVIMDECHNLTETHRPWLEEFDKKKGKMIGLTGTQPRYKTSVKGKLVEEFCPIMIVYELDEAIKDGVLNDYSIIVHQLSLDTDLNHPVKFKNKKTGKDSIFNTSELKNYLYWTSQIEQAFGNSVMFKRIMRMKAMMDFRSKEKYARTIMSMVDDKCIVFANTTAQSDRLCDHSYHSKNKEDVNIRNLKLFKEGEIDFLGCVLQISEGANIPNLKTAIILHAYGNEKKLMQRLGRMIRLKPDEKAVIHVLMYKDTADEGWFEKALMDFDPEKVKYIEADNF